MAIVYAAEPGVKHLSTFSIKIGTNRETNAVQRQNIERMKWFFWGLGIASFAVGLAIIVAVQGNPDHFTTKYPECMKLNGVVRCMTAIEKGVFEISLVIFLLSVFGNFWFTTRILEETGKKNPNSDNDGTKTD